MEIIANESENGLDSTKAECSPTISQVCTGYLGEYTGIFLHVKLQIEQLPFKNLESIETIKKIKTSKYIQHSQSKGHNGVSGVG